MAFEFRERGQGVVFELPPNVLVRLSVRQVRSGAKKPAALADLALGPDAIELLSTSARVGIAARLRLTAHNIGLVNARAVRGTLFDDTEIVADLYLKRRSISIRG